MDLRLWRIDDGQRHYAAAPTIREALTHYDVPEEVDEVTVTEVSEEAARRACRDIMAAAARQGATLDGVIVARMAPGRRELCAAAPVWMQTEIN